MTSSSKAHLVNVNTHEQTMTSLGSKKVKPKRRKRDAQSQKSNISVIFKPGQFTTTQVEKR